MYLPPQVHLCITALENAGFAAYAVGGCVRDTLLGLVPHDYDLCTAATPADICRVFAAYPLVKAGEKHGTIGVVLDGAVYEITTFRTEGSYADSRHPDWVAFVTDINQDLARRDFTVNAMAYSPTRGLTDPFGGQQDLRHHILRAVGQPDQRFTEDALRILRGVRFAARYHLSPEPETKQAMLALAPRLHHIAVERIFDELCKLLPLVTAEDLCTFAPILAEVIPTLKGTLGFDQRNPHHIYDLFTHTAHVVEAVAPQLHLRWAALLHDVGKLQTFSLDDQGVGHFYGHAACSAQMTEDILRNLKAPNALREQVVALVKLHMTLIEPEKKVVRRWMGRLGVEQMEWLLQLQEADLRSTATGRDGEMDRFSQIRSYMAQIQAENACLSLKDLAVGGNDLIALGYSGPGIGKMLHALLSQVLDEQLPNEKAALLEAAKQSIDHKGML